MKPDNRFCAWLTIVLLHSLVAKAALNDYFVIRVIDEQTQRGVPLVELKTVNGIRFFTDSNGLVAFHEPGLMGQKVFFHVSSHGYEFPKDAFGYRGKTLQPVAGGTVTLKLKRINVAERLYRVTGQGIYRDSLLAGNDDNVPTSHPVLNAKVLGSDSVVNALYRGRLYWFWGDTNRPRYPLGNFHVPGATSLLPADGGLNPDRGVELNYFVAPDGFAKATAPMPGKGPTWINGLAVVPDKAGRDRLVAHYVKVKPPMVVYEQGLCVFDDSAQEYRKLITFPDNAPFYPHGHPFQLHDGDRNDIYFADPYPLLRVPATFDAIQDLSQYEAFTCLEKGSRMNAPRLLHDTTGRVRYTWRHDAPAVGAAQQTKLVQRNLLPRHEALIQLRDVRTDAPVVAHRGSVCWNAFRHRWIAITVQTFGKPSLLGEVWYAEADTPLGPWCYATKIVTHNKYSFYNPKQHPYFDQQNGRIIYFEGTYTNTFSGNPDRTPRYNYNQIMYRLDLDDPRVRLPAAVYRNATDTQPGYFAFASSQSADAPATDRIAFFALDRPGPETIGICQIAQRTGGVRLVRSDAPEAQSGTPVFYALPPDADAPPTTSALFEFNDRAKNTYEYRTEPNWTAPGFQRAEVPLCRVWRSPWTPPTARSAQRE